MGEISCLLSKYILWGVRLGPLLSSGVESLTDAGVISSSHGLSVLPDVIVSSSLLDEITLTTLSGCFLE
jgi:hypothetical protein